MPIGALHSIGRESTDKDIHIGTVTPSRLHEVSELALTIAGFLCSGLLPLFPRIIKGRLEERHEFLNFLPITLVGTLKH